MFWIPEVQRLRVGQAAGVEPGVGVRIGVGDAEGWVTGADGVGSLEPQEPATIPNATTNNGTASTADLRPNGWFPIIRTRLLRSSLGKVSILAHRRHLRHSGNSGRRRPV